MRIRIFLASINLLAVGCAAGPTVSEHASQEFDESCDIMYTTTAVCHELGVTEESEDSCQEFSLEVASAYEESLALEQTFLEGINEICLRDCKRGIAGEEALTQSEACPALAANPRD